MTMRSFRGNCCFSLFAKQYFRTKTRLVRTSRPKLRLEKWHRMFSTGAHRLVSLQCARNSSNTRLTHEWRIGIDIKRQVDNDDISLPVMIYVYSPLKYLETKLNIWKLKFMWDIQFSESEFVRHSKQAASLVTNFARMMQASKLKKCTTPIGFKQISHDMLGSVNDQRMRLLRFRADHFRRAYPLKVKMLNHYDHKYAFIDMLFIALRRTNDFDTLAEVREMNDIINYMKYRPIKHPGQQRAAYPVVFAEIFIRFRRDYSLNPLDKNISIFERNHQWLISNYKILKFDILNDHMEFHTPNTNQSTETY